MVNEIRYTTVQRVLDDLLDHPMLSDLTLERVVRYTLKFIAKHGYQKLYEDKIDTVRIHNFRGELPCDLIRIIQVKDMFTGECLRSMTDSFAHGIEMESGIVPPWMHGNRKDRLNNAREELKLHHKYIPFERRIPGELTFKTQGRIIYTSFPEGCVEIAYKAIPVDENGFPLLIDNEVYLDALESYIKMRVFSVKFEQQKLPSGIFQHVQQEYALAAKRLKSEFTTPSISEMESITRMWNTLIPKVREFDNGFKDLGNREYLRKH